MSVQKHWVLGEWYPWRLIVHQQRYRPKDSNTNVVRTHRFWNYLHQVHSKVDRINQLNTCWQKIWKGEIVKTIHFIQKILSMYKCDFVPIFKPHAHTLYILRHCYFLFISYCLRYPRRYIYNACCISMILKMKWIYLISYNYVA
jgi:hypothetical protein